MRPFPRACLYICLHSCGLIPRSSFTKNGTGVKIPKTESDFIGPPFMQYLLQNGREKAFSDRITAPLAGKIQPGKETLCDVQNWRITNLRWWTTAILEVNKQVYRSHFLTDWQKLWSADKCFPHEGYRDLIYNLVGNSSHLIVGFSVTLGSPVKIVAPNIHCVSKKSSTFKLSGTLSNLNRFLKFLHYWKAYEICHKMHTTLPTSP